LTGHYLAFDLGTTALKTALVRDDGTVADVCSIEYTPDTPRPGWMEMDPATYWRAAVAGTRTVLGSTSTPPSAVRGIGLSSQGETFVPLSPSGEPLAPALVWLDQRAADLTAEWEADWLTRDDFRRTSGYPAVLCELTVFKLAWLARHAPDLHRAHRFAFLPDYLALRLTGELRTDYTQALMSGLFDLRTGAWHPLLLEAAGVAPEQLPPVVRPGTVIGTVSAAAAEELGLPVGVPVCAGCNDQLAGALGAGNVGPGIVSETMGTALAVVATTEALLDSPVLCVGRHPVEPLHYAMAYAPTSAVVLKWFRDLVRPGASYDEIAAEAADVPIGSEGLMVLPYFCGSGPLTHNSAARGTIHGLTLAHGASHIARAIMESCACLLMECLEPVVASGVPVESIRSLGGAARSDLWLSMKADLAGMPVERPAETEAACLGAAMMAAFGTGQFASLSEASLAWYRPARVFHPAPDRRDAYRTVGERYRALRDALYRPSTGRVPDPRDRGILPG